MKNKQLDWGGSKVNYRFMTLLVVFLVLAVLAVVAPKFGADTHESGEWAFRDADDWIPLRH
jgi:hypothetical protein